MEGSLKRSQEVETKTVCLQSALVYQGQPQKISNSSWQHPTHCLFHGELLALLVSQKPILALPEDAFAEKEMSWFLTGGQR